EASVDEHGEEPVRGRERDVELAGGVGDAQPARVAKELQEPQHVVDGFDDVGRPLLDGFLHSRSLLRQLFFQAKVVVSTTKDGRPMQFYLDGYHPGDPHVQPAATLD